MLTSFFVDSINEIINEYFFKLNLFSCNNNRQKALLFIDCILEGSKKSKNYPTQENGLVVYKNESQEWKIEKNGNILQTYEETIINYIKFLLEKRDNPQGFLIEKVIYPLFPPDVLWDEFQCKTRSCCEEFPGYVTEETNKYLVPLKFKSHFFSDTYFWLGIEKPKSLPNWPYFLNEKGEKVKNENYVGEVQEKKSKNDVKNIQNNEDEKNEIKKISPALEDSSFIKKAQEVFSSRLSDSQVEIEAQAFERQTKMLINQKKLYNYNNFIEKAFNDIENKTEVDRIYSILKKDYSEFSELDDSDSLKALYQKRFQGLPRFFTRDEFNYYYVDINGFMPAIIGAIEQKFESKKIKFGTEEYVKLNDIISKLKSSSEPIISRWKLVKKIKDEIKKGELNLVIEKREYGKWM